MRNLNEVVNQIYALTEDKEKTPESILSIIRSTIVGYNEDIVKIKKVNHRKNTLNNEDPTDFPLTNYEIINVEDGQRHNSDFYTNIIHALNRNLLDKKVIKAILNDYWNSPITKKQFESETDALYQLKQLFNNFNSSITEECNNRIDELAKSDPFIEQIRAEKYVIQATIEELSPLARKTLETYRKYSDWYNPTTKKYNLKEFAIFLKREHFDKYTVFKQKLNKAIADGTITVN
jgi:hypothetical protein